MRYTVINTPQNKPARPKALAVENLRTYFRSSTGEIRAVDGVDFAVDEGKVLCIVGESGCGKSLTALSIMGLIDEPGEILPDSRILLGDRDLTKMSGAELRQVRGRELSMIFQEPMSSLNPVMRIGTQIIEAIRLHEKISSREAMERAIEILRLVGITAPERRVREYPHQLSGGMRQRVMIAMALVCNPKVLIADEPTTALDVTVQAQILDLLQELREKLGMAVVFITHDLGVVAEIADEVAVMYAGQVIERGPAKMVLKAPAHVYTRALLDSIPVLGIDKSARLNSIEGMVPSPANWPAGCRFADRCQYAFDRCRIEAPSLEPIGDTFVACWLHSEPSQVAAQMESSK